MKHVKSEVFTLARLASTSFAVLLAALVFLLPTGAAADTKTPAGADQSSAPSEEKVPSEQANKARCVETDQIERYKTESDKQVRLFLKGGKELLLRLRKQCPQLHFHRYFSYTPVDGKICAGTNTIKTRAGLACRIGSISAVPANKP